MCRSREHLWLVITALSFLEAVTVVQVLGLERGRGAGSVERRCGSSFGDVVGGAKGGKKGDEGARGQVRCAVLGIATM